MTVIASLLCSGKPKMLAQGIQQCRTRIEYELVRVPVDPKLGRDGARSPLSRIRGKRDMWKSAEQQRGGTRLYDSPARDFYSGQDVLIVIHVCIVVDVRIEIGGVLSALDQKASGRLTTMGVDVLRTTIQRKGWSRDGLISMCGTKAGT